MADEANTYESEKKEQLNCRKNNFTKNPRSAKFAKLSKQEGIDEEEIDGTTSAEKLIINDGNEGTSSRNFLDKKENNFSPIQLVNIGGNKSKLLVRSQAFCGDDDTLISTSRLFATKSDTSSFSFDSNNEIYTDSTGIDLYSFIVNTLHKNAKDRIMLLHLEEHMTMLINDNTRNSHKFPAMSSYNRMLVHRVAAFFGLDHNVDQNGTAVVVNKTAQTRIPDVKFASLIKNDYYTDESRRLRRDAQSYEEGSHNLHTLFIPNRRAYSLELASYPNYPTVHSHHIQPGCEVAVAPQLMHVFYQQDSTSTDPGSTQLLESPGSCYSYNEMPYLGISDSSFNNTYAHPHIGAWSSSEGYNSFNSSVDCSSNVVSPVVHSSSQLPPLIPKYESNMTSSNMHFSADEYRVCGPRCNVGDAAFDEREVINSSPPVHPRLSFHPLQCSTANNGNVVFSQYVITPMSGRHYTMIPCVQYPLQGASPIHDLTQQMDSMCLTENLGTFQPPMFVQTALSKNYHVAPQQGNVPSQMNYYSNRQYYVPVITPSYVLTNPAPSSMFLQQQQPIYMATSTQTQNAENVLGYEVSAENVPAAISFPSEQS